MYPGLNFTYGVETLILYQSLLTSAIIKWWFSTSKGLRKMTTWYCYKMKIGFYHEVTWRGNSTTTKWRFVFIIKLLEGDTPPLQNEDWFLYVFLPTGYLGTLQYYKMTIGNGWKGFSHVAFRRAISVATKWLSIFKRLSTTETLKIYKMQFSSCGCKMPGPSPILSS